jgi:hypothetical protein
MTGWPLYCRQGTQHRRLARHCAAPIGPPTPCRPAIPRARSHGRVPRRNRIRIAAGRPSTRVYQRRRSARRPDSPTIPRAFAGYSMPWTGWPRIPVQPGHSRTDRQTCGDCGPAADLLADTDPLASVQAGISDQSSPGLQGPQAGKAVHSGSHGGSQLYRGSFGGRPSGSGGAGRLGRIGRRRAGQHNGQSSPIGEPSRPPLRMYLRSGRIES